MSMWASELDHVQWKLPDVMNQFSFTSCGQPGVYASLIGRRVGTRMQQVLIWFKNFPDLSLGGMSTPSWVLWSPCLDAPELFRWHKGDLYNFRQVVLMPWLIWCIFPFFCQIKLITKNNSREHHTGLNVDIHIGSDIYLNNKVNAVCLLDLEGSGRTRYWISWVRYRYWFWGGLLLF